MWLNDDEFVVAVRVSILLQYLFKPVDLCKNETNLIYLKVHHIPGQQMGISIVVTTSHNRRLCLHNLTYGPTDDLKEQVINLSLLSYGFVWSSSCIQLLMLSSCKVIFAKPNHCITGFGICQVSEDADTKVHENHRSTNAWTTFQISELLQVLLSAMTWHMQCYLINFDGWNFACFCTSASTEI